MDDSHKDALRDFKRLSWTEQAAVLAFNPWSQDIRYHRLQADANLHKKGLVDPRTGELSADGKALFDAGWFNEAEYMASRFKDQSLSGRPVKWNGWCLYVRGFLFWTEYTKCGIIRIRTNAAWQRFLDLTGAVDVNAMKQAA